MHRPSNHLRLAILCGASLSVLAAVPAFADEAAAGAAAGSGKQVEEVVVTARRITEKLQDVPAAISAVNQKQLETLKLRTLEDLSGFAPNVSIGRTGAGPGTSAIYVRGLGYSDVEKGQNPAVELIVDDVVIGTNFGQLVDPFDVSSVEVDRGPSGIFYGRNSIGGVINIHRTKPTRRWGLDLDVGYGDYNQNVEKGVLNAPLGPNAGVKVSISHQQRDGFINNIYTGDTAYGRNELTTGNFQLDWNITPKLEVNLGLTLTHQNGEGTPVSLGDNLTAQIFGPLLAPAGIVFNQYGSPYIPGVTVPVGPHQSANDFPDRNNLTSQIYSANLRWDSPIGQITSITAFMKENDDAEQDFDGSCAISTLGGKPCPVLGNPLISFLHTSRPQKYDQFSEELRINHDFGKVAKALLGFYYFHDDISAVQLTRTSAPGVPVDQPLINQISGDVTESKAVFGNVIFNITDRLHISGGFRYIDENTDFHQAYNLLWLPIGAISAGPPPIPAEAVNLGPVGVPAVAPFTGSKHASKVVDKFTVDYKITDNNLVYFDYSVGFRSGGLSPRSTLSEQVPGQTNFDPANPKANYSTFDPETDTSYEIGSKNTFFGNQLTVNLAGFITEDHNHQAGQVVITPGYGPGTNTYIVNIPSVEIKGVELEMIYRPEQLRGLTLMGSGGYQKATITDGKVAGVESPISAGAQAGPPGSVYDLTGNTLERVPEWNFVLRGDYNWQIGPGTADINIGYTWQDRYVFAYLAGLPDYQRPYGLLDLSVSYAWSRYKLILTAKNLTDEIYYSNTLPSVFFHGFGDPRTVLGEFQVRF
jgi:iron complex outermembrane recepter protein